MSIFTTHPVLRWAVPGVAVAAVVGAGVGSGVLSASADAGLAPRTAAQLLTDVQQARLDGLSGTVVQRADLGLPELPSIGGSSSGASGGSSQLSSLVSGTHTMRLWYAGPDKARVALLGTLGESDVIRNGKDVWIWSSQDKTAAHHTMTADDVKGSSVPDVKDLPKSPQEAADMALKAINPSTEVTTSGTARVAGRSAYELVLTPRDATSLVSSVRLAIDGEKRVPLRVQVFAKKTVDPVFEVAFSSVDFSRPEAAQFAFNPPPGTKVSEVTKDTLSAWTESKDAPSYSTPAQEPKVVGTGWGAIVVGQAPPELLRSRAGTDADDSADSRQLAMLLGSLPKVSGAWGSGHLLAGKLVSAVLTDDGRFAAGAVTPEAVYAALSNR